MNVSLPSSVTLVSYLPPNRRVKKKATKMKKREVSLVMLMLTLLSTTNTLEIQESMSDLSRIPWKPVLTSRSGDVFPASSQNNHRNHASRQAQPSFNLHNHPNQVVNHHHRLEIPIEDNLRLVLDAATKQTEYAAPLPSNTNKYRVGFIRASDLQSVLKRSPVFPLPAPNLSSPTPVFVKQTTPVLENDQPFSPMILKYSQPIGGNPNDQENNQPETDNISDDNIIVNNNEFNNSHNSNNASSVLSASSSKTSENFVASKTSSGKQNSKNKSNIFSRKNSKQTRNQSSGKIRETTTTTAATTTTTTTTEANLELIQQQRLQEQEPENNMFIEQQKQTLDEMNDDEEDNEEDTAAKIRDEIQKKITVKKSDELKGGQINQQQQQQIKGQVKEQQQQQQQQNKDDEDDDDVESFPRQQRQQEEEPNIFQQQIKGNNVAKKKGSQKSAALRVENKNISNSLTDKDDSSEENEDDDGFGVTSFQSAKIKGSGLSSSSSSCSVNMTSLINSPSSLSAAAKILKANDVLSRLPSFERLVTSTSASFVSLFLPSNEALAQLPRNLLKSLASDSETLKSFVENHIAVSESSRLTINSSSVVMTSLKDSATLRVLSSNHDNIMTVNGVRVSRSNQVLSSRIVVHVIEGVLFPPADKDVMETLKSMDRFDGFVTLAEGTGLSDTLRDGESSLLAEIHTN